MENTRLSNNAENVAKLKEADLTGRTEWVHALAGFSQLNGSVNLLEK